MSRPFLEFKLDKLSISGVFEFAFTFSTMNRFVSFKSRSIFEVTLNIFLLSDKIVFGGMVVFCLSFSFLSSGLADSLSVKSIIFEFGISIYGY